MTQGFRLGLAVGFVLGVSFALLGVVVSDEPFITDFAAIRQRVEARLQAPGMEYAERVKTDTLLASAIDITCNGGRWTSCWMARVCWEAPSGTLGCGGWIDPSTARSWLSAARVWLEEGYRHWLEYERCP